MEAAGKKIDLIAHILNVRKDNQESFAVLLKKYTPLIESLLSRYFDSETTKEQADDLRQEATLVFYNSILNFDVEQKEVEFGLYAKICITNALISQLRVQKRKKSVLFLDNCDVQFLSGNVSEDPAERLVEEENLSRMYSVIKKNLSEFELDVWQLYMVGKTSVEIGKKFGRDAKSINNAIYRIRKKLRALLK